MSYLTPRAARARRAVERWIEQHGGDAEQLDALADVVAQSAEELRRDLTPAEIESVCRPTAARLKHEREQAEAEAAVVGARAEQEAAEQAARAAYARACLLARKNGDPTPEPPRPGAVVYTLDPSRGGR